MKKLRLLLIGIAFGLNVAMYADEQEAFSKRVDISLSCLEERTAFGDPVAFSLTIRNVSELPISFFPPVNTDGLNGVIYISEANQTQLRKVEKPRLIIGVTKGMSPPIGYDVITLAKGESKTFTFCLDYESRSLVDRVWLFPNAGHYRIKTLVFFNAKGASGTTMPHNTAFIEIESPIVEIVVDDPLEDDKAARNDWFKRDDAWKLYAPQTYTNEKGADESLGLNAFRQRNSTSRYSQFAELCSINAAFVKGLENKDQAAMEENLKRCKELVENKAWSAGWRCKAKDLSNILSKYLKSFQALRSTVNSSVETDTPDVILAVPK